MELRLTAHPTADSLNILVSCRNYNSEQLKLEEGMVLFYFGPFQLASLHHVVLLQRTFTSVDGSTGAASAQ